MTQEHPITPPRGLVQEWFSKALKEKPSAAELTRIIAGSAAQWGADQELKACCEWMADETPTNYINALRAARRPKPPSLKEQALEALDEEQAELSIQNYKLIRAVLEALPE
jgi:hypothetical protein